MKLGVVYTVWNGLELLDGSISQIRDHVDVIVIAWQKESNKGEVNPGIEQELQRIKEKHDVVLVRYEPQMSWSTKENERKKHNFGLHFLKLMGCTHYMLSACDHYYHGDVFLEAKTKVEKMKVDVSITQMFTYYKHPTWQLNPIESYGMPFISRLWPHTEYVQKPPKKYPIVVDPSIKVNTCEKIFVFEPRTIMMHHYSMIRADIENKFRNAAASIRWTPDQIKTYIDEYQNYDIGLNKGIEYFQGRKIKLVKNYFNI